MPPPGADPRGPSAPPPGAAVRRGGRDPGPVYGARREGGQPSPAPAPRGPRPAARGRAAPPPARGRGAAPDWYDDDDAAAWNEPGGGDPWSHGTGGDTYARDDAALASGGFASPPWASEPPAPRRARLESTSSYRLASSLNDDSYDDVYFDDDEDADDDEGLPEDLRERRGCRNALVVLVVLALALAAAGWFGWSWVQRQIDPPGGQGAVVTVDVPEGTSTAGIGKVLARAGVIRNATVWSWYTKLRDVGPFQAGTYQLRRNSSFDEAAHGLAADPLPPHSRLVTVPEGYTLKQVLGRLADPHKGVPDFTGARLAAALKAPTSRSKYLPSPSAPLEGTLYPDTYAVGDGDTEVVVIGRMVDQFDKVMDGLGATGKASKLHVSPYQALIVASLVEKEARVPEDRPKVARVIYNRLAAGTPLGVDATLCYEKGQTPCKLLASDLQSNSPYNTRVQPGLPPTPIASPGKASIQAALSPAAGNWKYYVLVDADGHHAFTDSYAEFQRLKAECVRKGLGCG